MNGALGRGLRGSALEDALNQTNEIYLRHDLALVQKVPTPIVPTQIDSSTRRISEAFFDQKSTVDYIGAVQGIPVCFDAKECSSDRFPLKNIAPHQAAFMEAMEKQGGISFFVIFFTGRGKCYYLRLAKYKEFTEREENGGYKSFSIDEMEEEFLLNSHDGLLIPYLDGLKKDLEYREEKE